MAEKNMNAKISVEFEETANRQQLSSGDNLPTLFGKIKKFFTDLKPVALSGSYSDLSDKPESFPANGGNADTVDGVHAENLIYYYNSQITDTEMLNNTNWTGTPYEGVVNGTNATAMGLTNNWWHIKYLRYVGGNGYGTQIAFPITGVNTLIPQYRNSNGSTWNDWKNLADDGNAKYTSAIAYGICETEAANASKVITITDSPNWKLVAGSIVVVKFMNTNTATSVTLNVNNTGAKSIVYNTTVYTSAGSTVCGYANRYIKYMYDGTNWVWMGSSYDANTWTAASATANGYVSTGTQTFAGAKTFNGVVKVAGATAAGTSQVRNIAAGTAEATTTNCPNGALYGQYS